MNQTDRIITSLLLSLLIIFMGAGVSVVQCAHSGGLHTAQLSLAETLEDMECDTAEDCMNVVQLKLSPTDVAPSHVYKFHAVQPVIATFASPVVLRMLVHEPVSSIRKTNRAVKDRPRCYLNFIQVLLI